MEKMKTFVFFIEFGKYNVGEQLVSVHEPEEAVSVVYFIYGGTLTESNWQSFYCQYETTNTPKRNETINLGDFENFWDDNHVIMCEV